MLSLVHVYPLYISADLSGTFNQEAWGSWDHSRRRRPAGEKSQ